VNRRETASLASSELKFSMDEFQLQVHASTPGIK